jgi:hydroxyquinol 1,2-dioxygenase
MRNFDETSITNAVLERLVDTPSPRIREISAALVRHLHAFVREVRPTETEWAAGIDFLTRTGQLCSPTRQEFILLSDALGVSMLVDAINHPGAAGTTETTILGPFYVADPPEQPLGADISGGEHGTPLLVEGTVRGGPDGAALPQAWVETWHANADGYYDVQSPAAEPDLHMRARFRTDAQGRFWFRTIVPSSYPIPNDGPVGQMLAAQGRHPYRPAHVHFMVGAPGFETLVTHIFLAGDPYIDSDVVFGVKDSLIRSLEHQKVGTATPGGHLTDTDTELLRYDFVLAPTHIGAR